MKDTSFSVPDLKRAVNSGLNELYFALWKKSMVNFCEGFWKGTLVVFQTTSVIHSKVPLQVGL